MFKLRHRATGGHLRSYPFESGRLASSGQAIVTCATEPADGSDIWKVKAAHERPIDLARHLVSHGEIVRLEHVASRKNLHSHDGYPSPVTSQQEVTAFGEFGAGDAGDDWRVEVEGGGVWADGKPVRLIHVATGQSLRSSAGHAHPQWTRGQQEVTCFAERGTDDVWLAVDFLAGSSMFLNQFVPAAVEIGGRAKMTVTMRNVGTETWIPGGPFQLGSQNPPDNTTWGVHRVSVAAPVAPGEDAIFAFEVVGPPARGPAPMQWQMVHDPGGWFGEATRTVSVNVVQSGGSVTVPDLRGAFKGSALSALKALGLEVRMRGATSPRGVVSSQAPVAHSVVDRGTIVVLDLEVP